MSINRRTVTQNGSDITIELEIPTTDVEDIVDSARAAKATLDTIQDKLGTINAPDPQWTGATATQQVEFLRKATVALSEVVEKQLRIIIFLAGDRLDN